MAEAETIYKPGHYWDVDACGWVRYPPVEPTVAIPAQQQTGVEDEAVADVRSG